MVCLHSVPQPRRMFNNDPIGVLNISPLLAAHSMPPSTNLAGPHSQESPLRPPDCELYFHNNSFAEGNHIEKPTSLNMVHPATSQQNAPHMLLSDTHMSSIIDTQSPLGNPSISLRDNALFESMDHLLPLWYGESWSPDDGIGQRPHFPAEHSVTAGENSSHVPLDVFLPAFAFPLDMYLPQVHSFIFPV